MSNSLTLGAPQAAPAWQTMLGRLRGLLGVQPSESGAGVGRAALVAFSVRVLSAAIAYLTQIVLARWMGSSEYGVFVWVWVWVLILGGLSSLGLQTAVIRFVPQYLALNEPGLLRGVLRAGRAIPVLVAAAVAALTLTALWFHGGIFSPDNRLALALVLVSLPFYALTDVHDGIGRSRAWIGLGLLPPYVLRPLLILVAMVAAHAAGLPMRASTAAGAALVATVATAIVQWALMERRMSHLFPKAPARYDVSLWLRTSLPICFVAACELVLQNLDVIVLTQYVAPADVGVYFAALKSIALISFVNYAVGSAISGRLSELNALGNREGLRATVQRGAVWTFIPSLAGAIVLLAAGHHLLRLFGPGFEDDYPLMVILAVGFVIRSVVGPAEAVLGMVGEQKLCALVLFVSAVADVVLSLTLVPAYGIWGAAIANAGAMSVAAVLFYIACRWRLGFDVSVLASLKSRS